MFSKRKASPASVFFGNALSLWESWGEGLAIERNLPFLFLAERTKEGKEERFLFSVTQLGPHPNPLPKGEGVSLQIVGALATTQLS